MQHFKPPIILKALGLTLVCCISLSCGYHSSQNVARRGGSEQTKGQDPTTPSELLEKAIEANDLDYIMAQFAKGQLNIDIRLSDDNTPVIYSVKQNRIRILHYFLGKNPDLSLKDNQGLSALEYATAKSLERALVLLDPARFSDRQKQFHTAIRRKRAQVIGELLSLGADPNALFADGETPLIFLLKLIQDEEDFNFQVFEFLAKWKDPEDLTTTNPNLANLAGELPLQIAKQKNLKHAIQLLIELGAKEN